MKVTVIGSGVAVPSARRLAPALVVEAGGEKLLFDCGPDTLHGLLLAGLSHQEIDRIVISHFHPDHTLGLPHFLFASRYELRPRQKDLWLAGPPGLDGLLASFRTAYPGWLEERGYRLEVKILSLPCWETEGWRLSAAAVNHNPESLAYRLENRSGRSVVYSGDTGESDSLVRLARGADLLIVESSFPADLVPPSHLSPEAAGRLARRAGVGRVLLTHLYPPCEGIDPAALCRREFEGEVSVAEDGMVVRV